MNYLFEYHRYRNNPNMQRRIKQAMRVIIGMARRMGYSEAKFLSNKVAGQNAKSPGQLK